MANCCRSESSNVGCVAASNPFGLARGARRYVYPAIHSRRRRIYPPSSARPLRSGFILFEQLERASLDHSLGSGVAAHSTVRAPFVTPPMTVFGLATGLVLLSLLLLGALARARPTRYASISHSSGRGMSAKSSSEKPRVSVQILVLGDIGHSPRMQYHARSIAKHGGQVSIVGYQGMRPAVSCTTSSL